MCTAMHIHNCFGRTLDLEYTYGERVVRTSATIPLLWRHRPPLYHHHTILGMATLIEGTPLYYDAFNECGLGMAGLNFPHSGRYVPAREGDVASFELIPFVLGQCATVREVKNLLADVRVCATAFSPDYPATRLHWMVADETASIVVESTADGVRIYDNPIGVMTNEPTFDKQLTHWARFAPLSACEPTPTPPHLGRGSGSLGLPGDFTSPSRLVRGAFVAAHSEADGDRVGQFFHAIATVELPRGCLRLPDGKQVYSQYTCCMDLREKTYYYRTYQDRSVRAVKMETTKDA